MKWLFLGGEHGQLIVERSEDAPLHGRQLLVNIHDERILFGGD